MEATLWGRLFFSPDLDAVEGDYTFGDVNIWMECNLVDSFNMYETSSRRTIYVQEENSLIKFDSYGHFDGSHKPVTERTMVVYDYKKKKKTTFKMVPVKQEEMGLEDVEYAPLGRPVFSKTFVFDETQDAPSGCDEIPFKITMKEAYIYDEESVKASIRDWVNENESKYWVYKVVTSWYRDHIDAVAYCNKNEQ